MDEHQFCAQVQPIVNIKECQHSSFEILSRCNIDINIDNFFKNVNPSLGAMISLKVLGDTMNYFSDNPRNLQFNLSPKQLMLPDVQFRLRRLLKSYPANKIVCELTEVEHEDVSNLVGVMADFNELGMQFSLDDYGSGNSSLERLVHLPVKQIKIDRQFITNINACPKQEYVLKYLADFSRTFGIEVVCEGVERIEQHNKLLELGFDYAQGYLYKKPHPLSEVDVVANSINTEIYQVPLTQQGYACNL